MIDPGTGGRKHFKDPGGGGHFPSDPGGGGYCSFKDPGGGGV